MRTEALRFPERDFQVWCYGVSHGQLLLRSVKSPNHSTRVDVLFTELVAVHIPMAFHGLTIREMSGKERLGLRIQLGSRTLHEQKTFLIQGSNFEGYVVAAALFWQEDEGEYFDPTEITAFLPHWKWMCETGALGNQASGSPIKVSDQDKKAPPGQ